MGFCDSQEKPNDKRKLNDKHKKERGAAVIHRPTAPRFYYGCVTQQNDDFEGKGIKPLLLSKRARKPALYKGVRTYCVTSRCFCLRSAVVDTEFLSKYHSLNKKTSMYY